MKTETLAIIVGASVSLFVAAQLTDRQLDKRASERQWETALEVCGGHVLHDGDKWQCIAE